MSNVVTHYTVLPEKTLQKRVMGGKYMSSVIAPTSGAKCEECGGKKFKPKIYDKKLKLSVHVCTDCEGYPNLIRLRRYLPIGIDGKSTRVEIRENRVGEKISSIHEAMHIARSIDYDLRDGRFDPNEYRTKGMATSFLFKNLIKDKYKKYCDKKFGVGGYETKQVMINHLENYFGDKDIRKIKSKDLKEYQLIYECGERSKDLSIQEFGVLWNFFKELEIVNQPISLPKTNQSRERSIDEIITDSEQKMILKYIYQDDEYYGKMIELLTIYPIRPGDLRALKWKNINFHDETFTVTEHFAKSSLKPGRKSNLAVYVAPLTKRAIEILKSIPHSLNGEDFVFRSKSSTGKLTSGPVGEARMRIYWNKANKKANRKDKIKIVPLYVGTKSATMTKHRSEGATPEELMLLGGLTSAKTVDKYAIETRENKLKKVRNILNKESAS